MIKKTVTVDVAVEVTDDEIIEAAAGSDPLSAGRIIKVLVPTITAEHAVAFRTYMTRDDFLQFAGDVETLARRLRSATEQPDD